MNAKVLLHSSAVLLVMAGAYWLDNFKPTIVEPQPEVPATSNDPTPEMPDETDRSSELYIAYVNAAAECAAKRRCKPVRFIIGRLKKEGLCVIGTDPARIVPCPKSIEEECQNPSPMIEELCKGTRS